MNIPKHIALILDGNGRWAQEKGLSRTDGHKAGFKLVEPIAKYCNSLGVEALSLYCFSTENWNRPEKEVEYLMQVPVEFSKDIKKYKENNIKVIVSGRKTRAPKKTMESFSKLENETKDCTGLVLNICFDYGSLYDIKEAIIKMKDLNDIDEQTIFNYLSTSLLPKVDLLIRPGGEKRLSNYLLLESAYAELLFMDKYWPDFTFSDIDYAIEEFNKRNRRFGSIKK